MLTTKAGPIPVESTGRIRCVIADDHELVRYGVRRLLEDARDFVVVAEAEDASQALKLTLEHRPDLVLLDIGMPGMSSFEAGRLIEEHCPDCRIVYLTMHEDREYVRQAMRSGASGYLLKDTPTSVLLRALRDVKRGERAWSPRIVHMLRQEVPASGPLRVVTRRATLTTREREVMRLLAEGRTVRQAAEELGLSTKTVEAHKFNLMRKLDIHNKAQLVTVAIQKKILPTPIPM
ncbi:MAG TPA: response regulator transcription factor [Terriglobales bacterium]|nr:response regulator transcription factor [Terriglobales bacterium]